MIDIDPSGILVRYNVALEKAMTPEDAAEELYPKDKLIYPIAKAIFEGEEDDVVEGLKAAMKSGKDPICPYRRCTHGRHGCCHKALR